jgi:hypothetical protein
LDGRPREQCNNFSAPARAGPRRWHPPGYRSS